LPTPAVDTLHFVNVPCREQMPHFERTYETAGPDLAVVAINAGFNDSLDDVRTYRDKLAITMPIVLADARLDAALVAARAPPGDSAANIAASLMNPADISRYKVGDSLPEQSPLTLDGRRFRFRDSGDSRHTILVFLSPWCESYLATTRPRDPRSRQTAAALRTATNAP
jgi:thiol-disulfide isomerase/thioredoxin